MKYKTHLHRYLRDLPVNYVNESRLELELDLLKLDSKENLFQLQFYKAFASLERLEGRCSLLILWRNAKQKKSLEAHYYKLYFTHEGIKEVRFADISHSSWKNWLESVNFEYVELQLEQALSLIQDAYRQNIYFHTKVPAGFSESLFKGRLSSEMVNTRFLTEKLFKRKLTLPMFVNIYLAALRRVDKALLYDLSTSERQKVLGFREEYLLYGQETYENCTFLKSGIQHIQHICPGEFRAKTFAIISTADEQVQKIHYEIQILKEKNQYFVHNLTETKCELLANEHPEHPLSYPVFCSAYKIRNNEKILKWFCDKGDVFLAGELGGNIFYKWLDGTKGSWVAFDVNDRIICEVLISDNCCLIFAHKPENLVQVESKMADLFTKEITFLHRSYLHLDKLYQIILTYQDTKNYNCILEALKSYRLRSVLISIKDSSRFWQHLLEKGGNRIQLSSDTWYYYLNNAKAEKRMEVYLTGSWARLSFFHENIEQEIANLSHLFAINKFLYDYELENNPNVQVSKERSWQIFACLNQLYKEGLFFVDMGLVPKKQAVISKLGLVCK